MVDARMDGTPLEQAHWRIKALREALQDVLTTDDIVAAHTFVRNALRVDNDNALTSHSFMQGG